MAHSIRRHVGWECEEKAQVQVNAERSEQGFLPARVFDIQLKLMLAYSVRARRG